MANQLRVREPVNYQLFKDGDGNTLLHHACAAGIYKPIETLIKLGCSENALNGNGEKPLDFIRDGEFKQLATALIAARENTRLMKVSNTSSKRSRL